MRIRAPHTQAGLLQVRCRRADATSTASWWIAAHPQSPQSLRLVQPTSSSTEVALPAGTHHSRPSLSHRLFLALLCSSKGSDGRSEAMNATLLRLEAIARLISCRVTPHLLVSASRTAGPRRSGAIIRVSSRSVIQPGEGSGRGCSGPSGLICGHGLWGHHISSQAHPQPLPGSPLAFPRALLHSLNKRTWQDGRCESAWAAPRTAEPQNRRRTPRFNNTESAVGQLHQAFAALRIQEGPKTEAIPAVAH